MEKILTIGEALIDMICTDKGRTLLQGEHFLKKPGGAPTNVAAAIAALGGAVLLAEPVTARLLVASVAVLGGIALTIRKG